MPMTLTQTIGRAASIGTALAAFATACTAAEQTSSRPAGQGGSPQAVGVGVGSGGFSDNPCTNPGHSEPCFDGDPKLAGVGACALGKRTCVLQGEFASWGPCTGSGKPSAETCGDAIDADCDGSPDNGCFACDGISPKWLDPFKDGSLRVTAKETAAVAVGPNKHAYVCAEQEGRINVCSPGAVIQLSGGKPSIIGGKGIGSHQGKPIYLTMQGLTTSALWMLVDCTDAPVSVELATAGPVTITSKGLHELRVAGSHGGELTVVAEGPVLFAGGHVTGYVFLSSMSSYVLILSNLLLTGKLVIASPLPIIYPPKITGNGGSYTGLDTPTPAPLKPPGGCP